MAPKVQLAAEQFYRNELVGVSRREQRSHLQNRWILRIFRQIVILVGKETEKAVGRTFLFVCLNA